MASRAHLLLCSWQAHPEWPDQALCRGVACQEDTSQVLQGFSVQEVRALVSPRKNG